MPLYHKLGKIPNKRHTVFKSKSGSYYYEELFGTVGFTGMSSLLYHTQRPTQVKELLKSFSIKPEIAIENNIKSRLLKGFHCKLNIIPYNENNLIAFKQPSIKKIERFIKILYENQDCYTILIRWSKGRDIQAACGQLVIENI